MKTNLLLLVLFFSFLVYAYETGIIGLTKKNNGDGCVCHNFEPDTTVLVWLEGPDSLFRSDSAQFKIRMTGGPAVKGGFNVAALKSFLFELDTNVQVIDDELTHTNPLQFVNDTISWSFSLITKDSVYTDTIYSVANSVNGDGNPTNDDKWNFGENFVLNVIQRPVNVADNLNQPSAFELYQNYPNPFNPSTMIRFTIPSVIVKEVNQSLVTLKVYDIVGNEIATLINEYKPAGSFEVEFSRDGLSSGIYFYQLQVGKNILTRKMVLMK